ncbi:DUF1015 domain-containing protein [Candidatus Saganbacteria bacterium]|nr:DUF1015 domain-containing protein [Candidatus Saganbacteria bacterium]
MAKIYPFRGVLYNKKRLKKLSKVISPPYDVISEELQDELYNESDFKMVRLILGKEFPGDNEYNNKYVRAAASFDGWVRHGILVQDEKPGIYVYEQQFKYCRKTYSRLGVVALLRLEEFGKGKVFPHEHTLSRPKLDRIELMRAASANFDCVFSVFQDEKGKFIKFLKKFTRKKPDIEAKDKDGINNRLWRVNQKSVVARLQKEFKDKAVFIADGHHRYEAALRYRNEMKMRNTRFTEEEIYNHVMAYFTPIENPSLLVLPIHRIIRELPQAEISNILVELGVHFNITEIPFGKRSETRARKKLLSLLQKNMEEHAFGIYFKEEPNKYYLLTLKDEAVMQDLIEEEKPLAWKKLDVTILHSLILDDILNLHGEDHYTYTRDENEALDRVKNGEFGMAAILNPTKLSDVITIACKYERMPQKSTFFYPKLTTGMVINKIVHGEKVE